MAETHAFDRLAYLQSVKSFGLIDPKTHQLLPNLGTVNCVAYAKSHKYRNLVNTRIKAVKKIASYFEEPSAERPSPVLAQRLAE